MLRFWRPQQFEVNKGTVRHSCRRVRTAGAAAPASSGHAAPRRIVWFRPSEWGGNSNGFASWVAAVDFPQRSATREIAIVLETAPLAEVVERCG